MLLAHAGHWLTTAAYFVPVVAFLAWLVVTQIRQRRRDQSAGGGLRDTGGDAGRG